MAITKEMKDARRLQKKNNYGFRRYIASLESGNFEKAADCAFEIETAAALVKEDDLASDNEKAANESAELALEEKDLAKAESLAMDARFNYSEAEIHAKKRDKIGADMLARWNEMKKFAIELAQARREHDSAKREALLKEFRKSFK